MGGGGFGRVFIRTKPGVGKKGRERHAPTIGQNWLL